jgi:hypothetical protein
MNNLRTIFSIAVLFVLPNCSGGTDNFIPPCEDSWTARVLSSVDEVSEKVGISGQQALDNLDLHHVVTAICGGSSLSDVMACEGETELKYTIAYENGEVREITYPADLDGVCWPRLEIEVKIAVSTACGSLDETWDGVLNSDESEVKAQIDPYDFNGTYEILGFSDPSDPEGVEGEFSADIANDASGGSLQIKWWKENKINTSYPFQWGDELDL